MQASAHTQYIAYYRVSTQKQGRSGLGLEAQETTVKSYVENTDGVLLAAYTEVESGRKTNRPQLAAALRHCKVTGATLIIAKLDRLARNTFFFLQVIQSGVEILACDCPSMNKLTLTVFAAVAEYEADLISQRTKAALAAAKARGKKLGGLRENAFGGKHSLDGTEAVKKKADEYAMTVGAYVRQAQKAGQSLRQICKTLNDKGIKTDRGGQWYAGTVKNIISRLDALGV